MPSRWSSSDAWVNLPVCGCGIPEEWLRLLHWILWAHSSTYDPALRGLDWDRDLYPPKRQFAEWLRETIGETAHYGFLYCLDSLGFMEHGGGVAGAWLTAKGETAKAFLDEHGCNPDDWPQE